LSTTCVGLLILHLLGELFSTLSNKKSEVKEEKEEEEGIELI